MFLIILGLLVFFAGLNIIHNNPQFRPYRKVYIPFSILLVIAGALTSMLKVVDAGEIGVQSLFGKVLETPLYSGLNIVNPFVVVTPFNTKIQNYTMSGIADEGNKSGDDAIRVLTSDGLEVVIDLTVLYRVLPMEAPKILREIGVDYQNTLVRPITRTKIRDNAVYYQAVELYSTKRDEFQGRIYKTISSDFRRRGLQLEQLLVRNISLPATVKASIESKINAEQEAQKMQFVLQKERQEAERKRVEAQGISDYQNTINQSLTDKQLQYEMIKVQRDIATSPNTKVIILGGGSGGKSTPFILNDK